MKIVNSADEKLEPVFKGSPKLSQSTRSSIVKAWPWIALVFGILQVFTAFSLWRAANPPKSYGAYYESIYGQSKQLISGSDKFLLYSGFIILMVNGIILLMAYPKLAKKLRAGWDLLYLAALVNGFYAILSLFISGRGLTNFIFNGAASIISFWLLYQVKTYYN